MNYLMNKNLQYYFLIVLYNGYSHKKTSKTFLGGKSTSILPPAFHNFAFEELRRSVLKQSKKGIVLLLKGYSIYYNNYNIYNSFAFETVDVARTDSIPFLRFLGSK